MSEQVGALNHPDTFSIKDEKKLGSVYYLTGVPCPKGHSKYRYLSNGKCVHCEKESRERNKESASRYSKKYRTTLIGRAVRLRNKAQSRAKKKNLPFDLDVYWIESKLKQGTCEVTGLEFDFSNDERGPWTPSIDRTEPSLGYTEENCKVVCWIYNSAKSTFTHNDVLKLVKSLKEEVDE